MWCSAYESIWLSCSHSYPSCCVQFCKQLTSHRTTLASQDKPDLNRLKPFMRGKSTCGSSFYPWLESPAWNLADGCPSDGSFVYPDLEIALCFFIFAMSFFISWCLDFSRSGYTATGTQSMEASQWKPGERHGRLWVYYGVGAQTKMLFTSNPSFSSPALCHFSY